MRIAALEEKIIGYDLRLCRCNSSPKLKFKVRISRANTNLKKKNCLEVVTLENN